MIPTSLDRLLCQRRTLLLQGPMGPFFERLASRSGRSISTRVTTGSIGANA
jgi:capsule polysaccharide modification protein KpsS